MSNLFFSLIYCNYLQTDIDKVYIFVAIATFYSCYKFTISCIHLLLFLMFLVCVCFAVFVKRLELIELTTCIYGRYRKK